MGIFRAILPISQRNQFMFIIATNTHHRTFQTVNCDIATIHFNTNRIHQKRHIFLQNHYYCMRANPAIFSQYRIKHSQFGSGRFAVVLLHKSPPLVNTTEHIAEMPTHQLFEWVISKKQPGQYHQTLCFCSVQLLHSKCIQFFHKCIELMLAYMLAIHSLDSLT